MACAALVKNAMARGDGTTGLTSMSLSRSGANFGFAPGSLIDPTVQGLLTPYVSVRCWHSSGGFGGILAKRLLG